MNPHNMTYRVQSRIRSPYRMTLTEYALGVLALLTPLALVALTSGIL